MTPEGRAHVIMRMSDAPSLAALQRVWGSLSAEYQRDPELIAHKDRLKAALGGEE